jgi:hypothetical protein
MLRTLSVACAVLAVSACGSASAPATTAPTTTPSTQVLADQVIIGGLPKHPDFLISGTYSLNATLVRADGSSSTDCTQSATWATDNRDVARLISSVYDYLPVTEPGRVLIVGQEGEATVSATCAGVTGRQRVRVSHFDLRGTVRSSDGLAIGGALVRVRRSMQDASATVVTTSPDGAYSIPVRISNGIVEFSQPGFGVSSAPFTWNLETAMTADGALERTSGTLASGSGRLCNVLSNEPGYAECQAAGVVRRDIPVNFRSSRNGTASIRIQFPAGAGMSGEFLAALQCDGRNVLNYSEADGAGVGFSYDANTACEYRLVLVNLTSQRVLSYSYAIEIR